MNGNKRRKKKHFLRPGCKIAVKKQLFGTHYFTKLTQKGFHHIAHMTFKLLNPFKIKSQIEVGQRCLSLIHTLTVLYCRYICTN